MKKFNEYAMVSALCEREQDARDIKKVFNPEWLKDAELKPVLKAIYEYMDTQAAAPSIASLSQFMEEKDKAKFDARWRTTIEQLKGFDSKVQAYNVSKAKEAAAAAAFYHLIYEQRFQKMLTDGDANALKAEVSRWLSKHSESEDEGLYSLQEAIDKLVDDYPWQGRQPKVSTGIRPIDEWSGGLRAPQMGIIMAPTGHGKSALLMNIARHAAAIEQKTVLFITNELTVNEQTERFLVRMQNPKPDSSGKLKFIPLNSIQDDPIPAYRKLKGYQKDLDKHLYIYSAALGQNVNDIDEIVTRVRNERGVFPNVVVIDYLERMSTQIRMNRGEIWSYLGQIAKELGWLAKRRNCIIWTAIQTNRAGLNAKVDLSMEHAQNSIQQLQESSLAIGVRKVKVIDETNIERSGLEFIEMKSRHSAMEGRKMIVEADLSYMFISDKEIKNIKDIEDVDSDAPKSNKQKTIKGQAQVKGKV